jgi:hypothetical protein
MLPLHKKEGSLYKSECSFSSWLSHKLEEHFYSGEKKTHSAAENATKAAPLHITMKIPTPKSKGLLLRPMLYKYLDQHWEEEACLLHALLPNLQDDEKQSAKTTQSWLTSCAKTRFCAASYIDDS